MFLSPRQCVHISHIYMVPTSSQTWGISLQASPSIPHPRGLEKGADSGRRFSGNGLFLQLDKKYLQLFQVSFVCGQEGRAPRGAGALLLAGRSTAGQKPLPIRVCVGAQIPPAWPGTEQKLG